MTTLYFAGITEDRIPLLRDEGATHVLVSYADLRRSPAVLDKLAVFKVFLDCGAWSVASGACPPINVREYSAWVRAIGFPFELVAALDVIGDGAATERNYHAMLDEGLDHVVPTWHAEEDPTLAARYAVTAPYVAVGGLAARARGGNIGRFVAPAWPHIKHRRVHLFGVGTATAVIAQYQPTSVDATTWRIGDKFGAVLTLQSWPILGQRVVRPKTVAFRRARTLPLVQEMRRYGSSWAERARDDSEGRTRYNIRVMLDYMRRIDAVGGRAA